MGKAKVITVFSVVVFVCLLTQSNIASATTFTVGDSEGWTFNASRWPSGKSFKAGDVLVFHYPRGIHVVVAVGKSEYESCNPSGTTYTSGNDSITLNEGTSYFICGVGSHCQHGGMKIAITAS